MYNRPLTNEYVPLAEKYIQLVPEGNVVEILKNQHAQLLLLLQNLTEEQANYQYALGKWSLKTVVGHIADVERLWQYRVFRIARGDVRGLSGYDRDVFAQNNPAEHVSLTEVLRDYSAVRQATISLLEHLSDEALERLGEFSDHPLSARAAAFIIAGHEAHHVNILQERYLV